MKTLFIGALILGFAAVGNAQGLSTGPELKISLKNAIAPPINITYLSKVKERTISPKVLVLQNSVATFDLSASSFYKGEGGDYNVSFKNNGDKIYATFNDKGKILYSKGVFKKVIFPIPVRNAIYSNHPGWFVLASTYRTSYSIEDGAKEVYKVKIGKGMLQKRLRIDAEGNLL